MMPDLGQYATVVMSAYAVGVGLIVALTALTLWQARNTRAQLKALEKDKRKNG